MKLSSLPLDSSTSSCFSFNFKFLVLFKSFAMMLAILVLYQKYLDFLFLLKLYFILYSDLRLVPLCLEKLSPLFITIIGISHSLSKDESEEELGPASSCFKARLAFLRT